LLAIVCVDLSSDSLNQSLEVSQVVTNPEINKGPLDNFLRHESESNPDLVEKEVRVSARGSDFVNDSAHESLLCGWELQGHGEQRDILTQFHADIVKDLRFGLSARQSEDASPLILCLLGVAIYHADGLVPCRWVIAPIAMDANSVTLTRDGMHFNLVVAVARAFSNEGLHNELGKLILSEDRKGGIDLS